MKFDGLNECEPLVRHPEEAYGVEIHMADDVFIKQMVIPKAGMLVAQHSHEYEHTSMLAAGSVRVWKDGAIFGEFKAPTGIMIEKGCKHAFLSLEDNTIIYCIHNLHNAETVSVLELHDLGV